VVFKDQIRESRTHCEQEFDYLCTEFGCRRHSRYRLRGYEIYFWNRTTGVQIIYILRDPLFVRLCQLPQGKFPPAKNEHGGYLRIPWFNLLDIMYLKGTQPKPTPDEVLYGVPSLGIIHEHAQWLREYASDLLSGDFSLVPALRKLLEARRRSHIE
jgi:hypothetical protein